MPSLLSPVAKKSDNELVRAVQGTNDSIALSEIFDRHTGVYHMIVDRYSSISHFNAQEMLDDLKFNIYSFVMDYDETKRMKLSTFIGQRTKFKCLKSLEKSRKVSSFLVDDPDNDSEIIEAINNLSDPSAARLFQDSVDHFDIHSVLNVVEHRLNNTMAVNIIKTVHFPPDGITPTWEQVGEKVGMSKEGARQVYLLNIKKVIDIFRAKQ